MLTEASQNGHYDIVKLLIENNANINFKNEMGCSALHLGKLNMKYSVQLNLFYNKKKQKKQHFLSIYAGQNRYSEIIN